MTIEPVLKIACDLCGDFRHKTAVSASRTSKTWTLTTPPMPDGWRHTTNRGVRGPAYCLDGVEIICDTCHKKLADLKEQIRAESADDKAEAPTFVKFSPCSPDPEKHTVTANLDGQPIYFDGQKWRYEDTGEPVNPQPAEEVVQA